MVCVETSPVLVLFASAASASSCWKNLQVLRTPQECCVDAERPGGIATTLALALRLHPKAVRSLTRGSVAVMAGSYC
jgi:hypothetical protein